MIMKETNKVQILERDIQKTGKLEHNRQRHMP